MPLSGRFSFIILGGMYALKYLKNKRFELDCRGDNTVVQNRLDYIIPAIPCILVTIWVLHLGTISSCKPTFFSSFIENLRKVFGDGFQLISYRKRSALYCRFSRLLASKPFVVNSALIATISYYLCIYMFTNSHVQCKNWCPHVLAYLLQLHYSRQTTTSVFSL